MLGLGIRVSGYLSPATLREATDSAVVTEIFIAPGPLGVKERLGKELNCSLAKAIVDGLEAFEMFERVSRNAKPAGDRIGLKPRGFRGIFSRGGTGGSF